MMRMMLASHISDCPAAKDTYSLSVKAAAETEGAGQFGIRLSGSCVIWSSPHVTLLVSIQMWTVLTKY